jgi:hypothetical protein
LKGKVSGVKGGFTPFPSSAGSKPSSPHPADLVNLRAIPEPTWAHVPMFL